MKVRDSGMPERVLWESFFEPTEILELLSLPVGGDIVDFGCGYGTFTLTAATLTRGTVYGIDIDPEMVRATARGAQEAGLNNVQVVERDFVSRGSGLPPDSCSYAMLFNILHAEDAAGLLHKAHEILCPGGLVAVITGSWTPAHLAGRRWTSGPPRSSVSNGCRRRASTLPVLSCNCLLIITAWWAGGDDRDGSKRPAAADKPSDAVGSPDTRPRTPRGSQPARPAGLNEPASLRRSPRSAHPTPCAGSRA
jgi:SAM-dependent methyltransferase